MSTSTSNEIAKRRSQIREREAKWQAELKDPAIRDKAPEADHYRDRYDEISTLQYFSDLNQYLPREFPPKYQRFLLEESVPEVYHDWYKSISSGDLSKPRRFLVDTGSSAEKNHLAALLNALIDVCRVNFGIPEQLMRAVTGSGLRRKENRAFSAWVSGEELVRWYEDTDASIDPDEVSVLFIVDVDGRSWQQRKAVERALASRYDFDLPTFVHGAGLEESVVIRASLKDGSIQGYTPGA